MRRHLLAAHPIFTTTPPALPSPSHHLIISPSHHLIISPSHHFIISPSHHLTISSSHDLTISPSHYLIISSSHDLIISRRAELTDAISALVRVASSGGGASADIDSMTVSTVPIDQAIPPAPGAPPSSSVGLLSTPDASPIDSNPLVVRCGLLEQRIR